MGYQTGATGVKKSASEKTTSDVKIEADIDELMKDDASTKMKGDKLGGGKGSESSKNTNLRSITESYFDYMSPEDQKRFLAWEQAHIDGITPENQDIYTRFAYLIEHGVNYDNASYLAKLDRNIYEAFDEEQICKLINNVEEYAATLSNKSRTPAVAGVYNKRTGEFFYGINDKNGDIPQLVPELKNYLDNMPLDVNKSYEDWTKNAGSHAEIYALNDAIAADSSASIDDFLLYVIHGDKRNYGMPFERCPHCQWITQDFYSIYK